MWSSDGSAASTAASTPASATREPSSTSRSRTWTGSGGLAEAVALAPDGKILLGGDAYSGSGAGPAFVARLNSADGSFDSSFGAGGQAFASIGASATAINGMALAPNGQLVVGGAATGSDGSSRFLVARLNGARGDYDPSFGAGGAFQSSLGLPGSSQAAAIADPARRQDRGRGERRGQRAGRSRPRGSSWPIRGPRRLQSPRRSCRRTPDHSAISALAVSPTVFKAASSGGEHRAQRGRRGGLLGQRGRQGHVHHPQARPGAWCAVTAAGSRSGTREAVAARATSRSATSRTRIGRGRTASASPAGSTAASCARAATACVPRACSTPASVPRSRRASESSAADEGEPIHPLGGCEGGLPGSRLPSR